MVMDRRSSVLRFGALLLFAVAMLAAPARAYDQNDMKDCNQTEHPDRWLDSCTRLLQSRGLNEKNRGIALNNRGVASLRMGDYDRAIADFREAIRMDPNGANTAGRYYNLGFSFHENGDQDSAISAFNDAIRINPRFELAFIDRGAAFRKKQEIDRAIADFTEALRINPRSVRGYSNRADAFLEKGDYDRAIADCNAAMLIDPKDAGAYGVRGDVYDAKGDYDRAIADYSEAIRLFPENIPLFIGRGRVYEKIADPERARADYNLALAIPQNRRFGGKAREEARARLAALAKPQAPPEAAQTATAAAPATTVVAAVTSSAPSVATSPAAAPVNDRRIALVIGNSSYEKVPALPNPERDARLVAETLKRTGFQTVTVQLNLRRDALMTALREFSARAEQADWAVVYYAGHGMEVGGTNYLIPIDAKIAADRDISFEAVPLNQVLNAAERAKKLRLVILDACRDNPFASQMKRTLTVASRSVTQGLAAVEPEAGTLVVYAAKDGETAIDGDGNNSPFAKAFVRNLQSPGLEVRRLFDFVRDDVMEETGRKQKPFSYGSISGRQDFYFVAGK
jgi:tetratricopeptide (TPR) repeat protein